jgi:DNA-binding MarR family transcriptional regulator
MVSETTPPSMHIGFILRAASRDAQTAAQNALDPIGITLREYGALAVLRATGSLSQQELAARLGIDRTSTVFLIDHLEEMKLVKRRRSPSDRRAYALELTRTGARVHGRAQAAMAEQESAFLSGLTQRERQQLVELLTRLVGPSAE